MSDREKVFKGFKACCEEHDCRLCPYDDDRLSNCMQALMIDMWELLKAQEPRVLTRGEMYDAFFVEYESGNGHCIGEELLYSNGDISRDDYGYTWRVWSTRPTDEQRKAVKWE